MVALLPLIKEVSDSKLGVVIEPPGSPDPLPAGGRSQCDQSRLKRRNEFEATADGIALIGWLLMGKAQ